MQAPKITEPILFSDPNLAFSDDIDGHGRGFGSAWDIGADEYNEGRFEYRKQITISDSMTPGICSGNLSNFPVLVDTTNWPAADKNALRTVSNGGHVYSPYGYDIIFRASDGITQLDHEIERYNGTTGELIAWVRIPTLIYNGNTTIYIYYGNAGITSATQNPTGVWDTNYLAVYHMNQAPPSTVLDSKGTPQPDAYRLYSNHRTDRRWDQFQRQWQPSCVHQLHAKCHLVHH